MFALAVWATPRSSYKDKPQYCRAKLSTPILYRKKKQQQQRQINNENKNEQKPQSLALHDASLRSGSTFLSLQYKSAKMNGLMVISHSTGNQQQMQRYSFSEDASRPAGGVIIQSPRHYSVLVMTRNDVNRR